MIKVVLDYDGTLTAEERQVPEVTRRSLLELADHILRVPLGELKAAYADTVARLRAEPHKHHWEVNGLRVSYCDEGAFILNTVALQTMLKENPTYFQAVTSRFVKGGHDPVATCTHHLFHSHTAALEVEFRENTSEVLRWLVAHPEIEPLVLTNSLGDKVERNLGRLGVAPIRILGDTRQYALDPGWTPPLKSGEPFLTVDDHHTVDLRRRVYYDALIRESADGNSLIVVADTLSLPGALPLEMGLPFVLLCASYTPDWCAAYVEQHSLGTVADSLAALPSWVERLLPTLRADAQNEANTKN
jgi:hypothetical protein